MSQGAHPTRQPRPKPLDSTRRECYGLCAFACRDENVGRLCERPEHANKAGPPPHTPEPV